jgi:protocatechuate 3,4-dioxygenase beta subunit
MAVKPKPGALALLAVVAIAAGLIGWRVFTGGREQPPAGWSSPGKVMTVRPRPVLEAWRTSPGSSRGAISGTVRNGNGGPASGAVVALVVAAAYEDMEDRTTLRPRATTIASGDGTFRFAEVPPGRYLLTATGRGWAQAELPDVSLLAGEAIDGLELRLARGGVRLYGRISDAGGGPIGGAGVRALALGAGGRPDGARTFLAAAGTDGSYQVVLRPGSYRVVADAEGYTPEGAMLLLDRDRSQDFRLAPGARITGRVVDPNQAAVDGAHVMIEADAVILRPSRAAISRATRTDAVGGFAFAGVPPGSYRVSARAPGLMGTVQRKVIVSAGASVEVLVSLTAGPSIAGRVLDSGGRPVMGARVRAGELASAVSGAEGKYRLDGLIPGPHSVTADARGLAGTSRRIALGVTDLTGVDLVLEVEAVVAGRVLDRIGKPVTGASVTALVATPDALADQVTSAAVGRTDVAGTFTLGGLGAGDLRVEAEHPEHGRGVAGPLALSSGGRSEVEIRIGQGGMVRGSVRWDDQKPAHGALVSGSQRRLPPMTAATDEQGRYELGPFPSGEVTVDARPETDALERGGSRTERRLTLAAGQDVAGIDFIMVRRDERISGIVRDPEGQPLAGATIGVARPHRGVSYRPYNRYAGEADGSDYTVLSDGEGAFTVRFLPKGTFDVWATHPRYVEADTYSVPSGSNGVVLQFAPGGLLAGMVTDGSGRPIPAFIASALLSHSNDATAQLRAARGYVQATEPVQDPAGAFELNGLHPAAYDVLVTTADGRGGRLRQIPLGPGEAKRDLRVIVGPTSLIKGRVVDETTGRPIAGATVVATLAMLVSDVRARSGVDGKFRLEGIVPGDAVLITVRGDGRSHGVRRQSIAVPAGVPEVDAGVLKLPVPATSPPAGG